MNSTPCPRCQKQIQCHANGRIRNHAVPIEQRPPGAGYTPCPASGHSVEEWASHNWQGPPCSDDGHPGPSCTKCGICQHSTALQACPGSKQPQPGMAGRRAH